MILNCQICSTPCLLDVLSPVRKRKGAVVLCEKCWRRAEAAYEVAQRARRDTPEFIRGLFDGKQN